MSEQVVQTYNTWTHGAQPTWLQFHGTRGFTRQTHLADYVASTPAKFPIASSTSSSTTPPLVILHPQFIPSVRSPSISAPRDNPAPPSPQSQRTRRSIYSTDHPVMKSHAVQGARPSDLGQHPLQRRGDLDGPSQSSPPNVLAVHRSPHRQLANTTVCHPAPWAEMSCPLCS